MRVIVQKKKFGNFLSAKRLYRGPTKILFSKIIIFVLESICMTRISYLERIQKKNKFSKIQQGSVHRNTMSYISQDIFRMRYNMIQTFLKSTLTSVSIEPSPCSIRPLVAEIWRFEHESNSSKKMRFREFPAREGVIQRPYEKNFSLKS